jgi:hypothetical protein
MKITCFLLILLISISCANQKTTLFYYNGSMNNGKYILGSDLKYFFLGDDIAKVSFKEQSLSEEMLEIKEKIILRNNIVIPDDSYYVFAFTSKKDTLFADNKLEFWRYKDKGMSLKLSEASKKEILKKYKLHSN